MGYVLPVTTDFAVKPTLTGDKVVLRPFIEADIPPLRRALRDRDVLRLTGSVHDDHDEFADVDLVRAVEFLNWRNAQLDRLDLAVVDRAGGECVGEVVLNQVDEGNRSCNFRTFLGPDGQDRGLGTEALRLIVGYGFEEIGLHRISLEVYAFNPRARHVYEKAGFVAEGVLRESLCYGGEWIDATVMSILAPEWARHHGYPGPERSQP
jgi:RimJ/RimL family protein N-acetyltransferase